MKTKLIFFLVLFMTVICFSVFAEDVATYSGTTYTGCRSIGDTNVFLTNPNDYATIKAGYIYLPSGCKSLPSVDAKFLKISGGAVVEMSQAEKDNITANEIAQNLITVRTGAKASMDGLSEDPVFQRAFADVTLDEINNLRQWITSFKAQVALASTLADLKSRVAGLPSVPDRTRAQLKTALKNRVDSGNADS